MPSNNTGQIAIWQRAVAAVEFSLSNQDTGVRVSEVPSPHTTVNLPPVAPGTSPNDGDEYAVLDEDGSCGAGNQIVIVPPAGTTIRGAASFSLATAFESALVSFDSVSKDWTVELGAVAGGLSGTEAVVFSPVPATPSTSIISARSAHQSPNTSGPLTGATNLGSDTTGGTTGVSAAYGTLLGGDQGVVSGPYGVVCGGLANAALQTGDAVVGGEENTANGGTCFVGGGTGNQALGASEDSASVVGGADNTATGQFAATVGGLANGSQGSNAFVGGGASNAAFGTAAAVGSGEGNQANGGLSFIGAGGGNTCGYDADNFTIPAGGTVVTIVGDARSRFANGDALTIQPTTPELTFSYTGITVASVPAFAAGHTTFNLSGSFDGTTTAGLIADQNIGEDSVIGGGSSNQTTGAESVIAGGEENQASGQFSSVGGGANNIASASGATVSGGLTNTASAAGAAVPGGQANIANGQNSLASGTGAVAYQAGQDAFCSGGTGNGAATTVPQTSKMTGVATAVSAATVALSFGPLSSAFLTQPNKAYHVNVDVISTDQSTPAQTRAMNVRASVHTDNAGLVTVDGSTALVTCGSAGTAGDTLSVNASGVTIAILYGSTVAAGGNHVQICGRVEFTEVAKVP